MENLHLKNLNRTDIINDCIKLKEAGDAQDDEKIEYYINKLKEYLFPITLKPRSPDFHIYQIIVHIRNLEQSIIIDKDYPYIKDKTDNIIRNEVIKYINNLKNYERRILPQIEKKLKDLKEITDTKEKQEKLYNIEEVYTYYMFFYKSNIPEITQIAQLLATYANNNNKSKDFIINYCKNNISYFKDESKENLYKENLNPQFNEYYNPYQRQRNNDPKLKEFELNQTANELLDELLDKYLKKSLFEKLKDKF